MDGINGVLQRVHGIEARLRELQATAAASASFVGPGTASSPGTDVVSFSRVLDQSLASQPATLAAVASAANPSVSVAPGADGPVAVPTGPEAPDGPRDARGVPLELLRYGNGNVPASALRPVGQGIDRLWAPAATAFDSMRAAAADAGVRLSVTDSYRSYTQQVDMARRKGLYSQGGLAAAPGTSEHGWGLSLDLGLDADALRWMRAHAKDYGFSENVAREPWHWTFTG